MRIVGERDAIRLVESPGSGTGLLRTRHLGEPVLRVAVALALFYVAAFFELVFASSLYAVIYNGQPISVMEILAFPVAIATFTGIVFLAALPLRGVPRIVQLLVLATSVFMLIVTSRPFWQREELGNALFTLLLAGTALYAGLAGWTTISSPLRFPWRVAAFGVAMIVAGFGYRYFFAR